ncbi:MAG: PAS domain S-box protein, partial [Chloroflexi bacterium]|nr:PAS domain S-box protein [Chloroflexota bacterium]
MVKISLLPSARGRIIAGFGLLVLILAIVVAGSAWLTREHRSGMAEMQDHIATTSLLQNTKVFGALALTELQRYLASGDESAASDTRAYLATATDSLAEARAQEEMRGDEREIANLDEIIVGTTFFSETAEQVIALRQSGDVQGAAATLEAAMPQLQQSAIETDQAVELERQEVAALRSQADRTSDLALWFAIIAGVMGAVLGVASSVFIARSIMRPLSSLESAALAVADGDLSARAPTTGLRELARLGASINRMTESLLDASKRQELESELRESEERYRALVETSPDVIYTLSPDGTLTSLNPAFETVTGWPCAEWIGKNFAPIIHPDDRPLAVDLVQRLLRGEEIPPTTELRIATKSGEDMTGEFASTLQMQKGRVLGVLGIARDITERKQAEEALRESEQRFRNIFSSSNDAIFVIDPDQDMIIDANSKACSMLGYPREELVGMPMSTIHPNELSQLMAFAQSVSEHGQGWTDELTCLTKTGRALPAEISASRIDIAGRSCMIASVRDISERKRAEEALRGSEQRFRGLLESAPDACVIVNTDGRIVLVNTQTEKMFGYSRDELIGEPVEMLMPERSREAHVGLRTGYYSEPRTRPMGAGRELAGRRKDGSEFPVDISLSTLETKNGILVTSVVRDISERKRAEEALRESEQRFRDLYENAPNAYFSVGADDIILSCNCAAEELLGYTAEELVGRPALELYADTQQGKA